MRVQLRWSKYVCLLSLVCAAALGALSLPGFARVADAASQRAIASSGNPVAEHADAKAANPDEALSELQGLRTADSDTYQRADGTRVARLFDHPVNYLDGSSGWQPIDDELVPSSGGRWQTKASGVPVSLPPSLAEGAVSIGAPGSQVSIQPEGAGPAPAAVSGTQGSYAAALPETSVAYSASASSVRETLTLASAAAPTVYRYALSLSPGLHATLTRAGTVEIRDASGKPAYYLAAPVVEQAGSNWPLTAPVHYELSAGGTQLSLVLSSSWLHDPARSFPVRVDPDIYWTEGSELTCTIRSGESAETSLCGQPLTMGSNGAHEVSRIVSRVNLSAIPQDAEILGAYEGMYFRKASSTTPVVIQSYDLSREITESVTWNAYDGSHSWSSPGGDFTSRELPGGGSTNYGEWEILSSYAEGWEGPPDTALVEKWVREPSSNHGLIFKAANEENGTYDEFDPPGYYEETGLGGDPVMEVDYTPQIGTPASAAMTTIPLDSSTGAAVDIASGNLLVSHADLRLPGPGYDFSLSNIYNSLSSNGSQEHGKPEGESHPWREHLLAGMTFTNGADVSLEGSFVNHARIYHDPSGAYWLFERDHAADKEGNEAFYSPPGLDATLVVHSAGNATLTYNNTQLKYEFNYNGQLEKIVDTNGNTTSFTYNGEGKTTGVTDTRGNTLSFEYKSEHEDISKIKDQLSRSWKFTENASNQMTSATNPDGGVTKYAYSSGKLTEVTDADKHLTVFSYEGAGRISEIRRVVNGTAAKAGSKDVITTFAYSIPVSPSVSCPSGTYGDTQVVSPDGSPNGVANGSTAGHKTFYCFNDQDQVTKTIDQAGNNTTTSYNAATGEPETFQNPGDTAGGLNVTNTIAYDKNGAVEKIIEGTGESSSLTTTFVYSGSGPYAQVEPSSIQTPFSAASQAEHEGSHTTYLGYEEHGNLDHVQQGSGEGAPAETLEHNANGEVTASTDADGHTTKYEYNATHDLIKIVPPSPLGVTEIGYDTVGRVHSIKNGNGVTATFTYNGEDAVTKVEYSDGSSVSFEYDADGNTVKRTDAGGFGEPYTGITTYEYSKLGQPVSETTPSGRTTTYEYDYDGNLTSLSNAGGAVTYAYGPDDVLSKITEPGLSSHPFKIAYDSGDDDRKSITYPSGVLACYENDAAGRLTSLKAFLPSGGQTCSSAVSPSATLEDYSLSYQVPVKGGSSIESGELQELTNSKAETKTEYSYDTLNRILAAVTKPSAGGEPTLSSEYEYDKVGNLLLDHTFSPSTTYANEHMAYNAANEVCAIATSKPSGCASPSEPGIAGEPTFDADGDMTSDGSTAPAKFGYTVRDQLSSVTPHGGSATQVVSHGTGQDDLAAIGSEEVVENVLGVGVTGSGESAHYYTRGSEGSLLAKRTAKGTASETEYYVADPTGSPALLTSSSGAKTAPSGASYQYDAYGNPIGTAPSTFGYRGGEILPDGLVHYGARYYDPAIGRWTQPDPLNQIGSLTQADRFAYAGSDPLNHVDLAGLSLEGEFEEGLEEAGEYAEAGLVGCVKGAAESAIIAGPDAAEGGCGYGAVSGIAKKAGCDACAEVVDLVGKAKDIKDGSEEED